MIRVKNNAKIMNFFCEIKNLCIEYKLMFIVYRLFIRIDKYYLILTGFNFSEFELDQPIISFKQFDKLVYASESFGD